MNKTLNTMSFRKQKKCHKSMLWALQTQCHPWKVNSEDEIRRGRKPVAL